MTSRQQITAPPRQMPTRLWTVAETAAFLGIPASTLYYWSYRGEGGPRILRIGRALRYNPYDVDAWARSEGA